MLNNKRTGIFMKASSFWAFTLIVFFSVSMNYDWRTEYLAWYGSLALVFFAYIYVFNGKILLKDPRFLLWFLLFLSFGVLSLTWSLSEQTAMDVVKSMIVIFAVLAFIQFSLNFSFDIDALLKGYLIATLINALYVVVAIDIGRLGDVQLGTGLLQGWNANGIGFIMAQGAAIGCYLWQKSSRKALRFFYLLCIVALALLMVYTGSRTAFVMLLVELSLYFWLNNPTKKMRNVFIAIMVLLVVYYLVMNVESFYNVLGVRLEGLVALFTGRENVDSSASIRAVFVENGKKWFLEQPIIGYGLNNYKVLNQTATGRFTYAHNNFIEIAVDLGVVGFLCYYSAYVYLIFRLLRKVRESRLNVFLFSALLASLVSHYGNVAYYDFYQNFLLLLCFFVVNKREKKRNEDCL